VTPQDIETSIKEFVAEFMGLQIASRDESLTYVLSSIQQFELMVYVESELGVALEADIFADAGSLTLARLAELIATRQRSV
jgi:acyl carrier protein